MRYHLPVVFSDEEKYGRWALPAVLGATVLAFGGSVFGTRIFDDFHSVFDNPAVKDPANIIQFFLDPSAFSVYAGGNYRPITLLTYALTFGLFGENTAAFHAGNLLFHLTATALVFFFLRHVLRKVPVGRADWPAALGAIVFGIHPAAGQVVHYISSRSESLAMIGIIGALFFHCRTIDARSAGQRFVFGALTAGAVAFGLGAKETGILALPLLVVTDLAVDRAPARTVTTRLLRLLVPAVLVALYIGTVLPGGFSDALKAVQPPAVSSPGPTGDPWILKSLRALWSYLLLFVWPAHLAPYRELSPTGYPYLSAAFAGGLIVSALLSTIVFLIRKETRARALALALFIVPFVPYLFKKLLLVINENRAYPPLAGLALGAALLWAGPLRRFGRETSGRRLILAAGLLILGAALARDWKTSYDWSSEIRLWENAVTAAPGSGEALAGLGTAYMRQKRWDDAVRIFRRAIAKPARSRDVILDNLGIASYMSGDKEGAFRYFLQAYDLNPKSVEILNHVGSMFHETGQPREALFYLDRAARLAPGYCEARIEAILANRTLGLPAEARRRIAELPRHCLDDPRVNETRRWAGSTDGRGKSGATANGTNDR